MRKNLHRPPHLYIDNTIYFITAGTVNKAPIIDNDAKLTSFASLLHVIVKFYDFELIGWVVLKNHYHLLLKIGRALELSNFIRNLHGKSAFEFNKIDRRSGRQVWYQYWDTCIRDEKTMYTRLNYIHNNPIKHSYVRGIADYKYSSYGLYLERFGKEWLDDVWQSYPVIDYLEEEDF